MTRTYTPSLYIFYDHLIRAFPLNYGPGPVGESEFGVGEKNKARQLSITLI